MQIRVLGMDPSMNNWGLAEGLLDLDSGILTDVRLELVKPDKLQGKQVRQNSTDLHVAEQLARAALGKSRDAKAIFVEVPVGSQSARAMASYGLCVGVLGAVRATGIPLIEVTPTEVKKTFTGNKNATKDDMIAEAIKLYPEANWPYYKRNGEMHLADKAEHLADAIASIHAGVQTSTFQNLMRLFQTVRS